MNWAYGAVEEKDAKGEKILVIAEIYFNDKKISSHLEPIGYAVINNYHFVDNITQITEDLNHQVQSGIMFKVKSNEILMIKRKVSLNGRNKK